MISKGTLVILAAAFCALGLVGCGHDGGGSNDVSSQCQSGLYGSDVTYYWNGNYLVARDTRNHIYQFSPQEVQNGYAFDCRHNRHFIPMEYRQNWNQVPQGSNHGRWYSRHHRDDWGH